MVSSNLVELLQALDKKELSGFIRFVESGLEGANNKGVELLKMIRKAYPHWASSSLEERKVAKKLFPGDKSRQNLKRLRSQLLSLLKEYLIILELQDSPEAKELFWLNAILKRGQYSRFKRDWARAKQGLEESAEKSAEYFFYRYQLEDTYRKYIDVDRTEKEKISFQAFFDNFECYTIIEKLKYCCYAQLLENVQDMRHEVFMLDDLEKRLEGSEWLRKNPVIYTYYTLFRIFKEKNTGLLFAVLEPMLADHKALFTEEELKDLNNLVPAYLINRINNGHSDYLEKLFQWNQSIIGNGLVFEGAYIPHQRFKNIVSCALLLRKFDWIQKLLKEHILNVKPSEREGLRCFIEGTVHYYQKNFREAIKILQLEAIPNNDFYFYDIHSLLLRAYYELEDFDGFRVIFNRLKKKIWRDSRTSRSHQKAYQNFSELLLSLIKIRENPNLSRNRKTEQLRHLGERVSAIEPMLHKKWLEGKILMLIA